VHGMRVAGSTTEQLGNELASAMIGESAAGASALIAEGSAAPRTATAADASIALQVDGLSAMGDRGTLAVQGLSLKVRKGEILGIAGVSGNGQKELLTALSGEMPCDKPRTILLKDAPAGHLDPAQRRALGLGFVPEERLGRGAVPELSLADNALLTGSHCKVNHGGMVRYGMIRREAVRSFAREVIGRFKVKTRSEQAFASSLSGGNLQKFIVGRETMLGPEVIVVAQPTWGVDVGASMLIRQSLVDLRDAGVAVLVISEELDELFMICDRLAVIAEGRLSPPVPTAQTSVEQIGAWMGGQFAASGETAHA